ncbi:uncharacterized protein METZ01_LOCUS502613 [marine metagenome]|jgi:hypothetical protein|uniref:DUF1737 domain-containing protein n=1 Tax=marine metagenome TaxID=408172 RepID=A0A383DZI6_9ZZZZ|tara:strand:+ start:1418 stop:1582 length:165 start_codon:yes stop_codon:yes gene_type:complete
MGHEKYKIVEKQSGFSLEREVNKMIKEGWKPQGGLQIVRDNYDIEKIYQAMVKE